MDFPKNVMSLVGTNLTISGDHSFPDLEVALDEIDIHEGGSGPLKTRRFIPENPPRSGDVAGMFYVECYSAAEAVLVGRILGARLEGQPTSLKHYPKLQELHEDGDDVRNFWVFEAE